MTDVPTPADSNGLYGNFESRSPDITEDADQDTNTYKA